MTHADNRRAGLLRTVQIMIVTAAVALALVPAAAVSAQEADDPRVGLEAGWLDAEQAASNMELLEHIDRPEGFVDPENPGDFGLINSDLAFTGDHAIMGSYKGFTIYDISDPANATLETAVVCPGGQGDVSVYGDLLFVSVQGRGTLDCTTLEEGDQAFVGVRIFDISDIDAPQQVGAVQTCRGSHTHTVVEDPDVDDTVWIYVSGTSGVRDDAPEGLECVLGPTETVETEEGSEEVPSNNPEDFLDENGDPVPTDRFQIPIIEVPLDSPQDAEIVNEARVFQDYETGNPFGLEEGTDTCHDITAYAAKGLAAGACQANGLLLDISDPVDPVRIDAVNDGAFDYWHSATFDNEADKVVFTDELGGGVAPVCTADIADYIGANAIYDIVESDDGELTMDFASYYKLPAPQTEQENCVAHNGSIVPVPGRDIMVQAWYQGGISVMDFTDSANPREIAFFDRGPVNADELVLGGFWSAYYYNGYVYGSGIARGFDVLGLTASDALSNFELGAARAVQLEQLNPQAQPLISDDDRVCDPNQASFSDVDDGVHAYNIGCVAAFGIAAGYEDGRFRPGTDVGRSEMASFLQRTLQAGGVELPADPPDAFDDDDGSVHEMAINQLAELGVTQGVGERAYDPTGQVTRAQAASFVVRTVEAITGGDLTAPGEGSFTDVNADSVHADDIRAAAAVDIVNGVTETQFAPTEAVSRNEVATLVARALEHVAAEGVALSAVE